MTILNTRKRDRLVTRVLPYQQRLLTGSAPPDLRILKWADGLFTRGSEGSYETGASSIAWAPENVLRLADWGDGNGPVALFEGPSSNRVPLPHAPPADPTGTVWNYNAAIATGQTDPAGGTAASRAVYSGSNQNLQVIMPFASMVAFGTFASSLYARKVAGVTDNNLQIQTRNGTTLSKSVDLGEIAESWARYATTDVYANSDWRVQLRDVAGAGDFTIDTAFWQIEALAFATSYIRSGSARAADRLTFTEGQIPAAFNNGRWAIDFYPLHSASANSTGAFVFQTPEVSFDDGLRFAGTSVNNLLFQIRGVPIFTLNVGPYTRGTKFTFYVDLPGGYYELHKDGVLIDAGYFVPDTLGIASGLAIGSSTIASRHSFLRVSEPLPWDYAPEALEVNFATMADFSRASEASYITAPDASAVAWAPPNTLRYEDRGDGYGPLALVEPAGTNLHPNPNNLEAWALKSNVTPTNNVRVAPDGSTTAALVDMLNDLSANQIRDNVPGLADSTVHTASIYLKGDVPTRTTARFRWIQKDGTTDGGLASIDINQIWKRFTAAANSGTGASTPLFLLSQGTTPSADDYVAWGGQVESTPWATSFIRTPGVNGRAADSLIIRPADAPRWLESGAFMFVWRPRYSSAEHINSTIKILLGAASGSQKHLRVSYAGTSALFQLYNAAGTVVWRADNFIWARNQPVVFLIDFRRNEIALFNIGWGGVTQTGTYLGDMRWAFTGPAAWPVRTDGLGIGRSANGLNPDTAAYSEPVQITGGLPAAVQNLKGDLLNFADGVFTRDTEASFESSPGVLQWYPANTPRVRSDGLYLFEGPSTNLVPAHQDVTAAGGWSVINGAGFGAANAHAAPDGTLTADEITLGTGAGSRAFSTAAASGLSIVHVLSYYARQVSGVTGVRGNLLPQGGSEALGADTPISAAWKRIVGANANQGAVGTDLAVRLSQVSAAGVAGTVAVWGAQVEANPFPTSYIRLGPSTPRGRELLKIPGAVIPPALKSGRWQFDVVPMHSSTGTIANTMFLYAFLDNSPVAGIAFISANTIRLFNGDGATVASIGSLVFSAGDVLTVSLDLAAGVLHVQTPTATSFASFTPFAFKDRSEANALSVGTDRSDGRNAYCAISRPRAW